jgi:hypothetical protein
MAYAITQRLGANWTSALISSTVKYAGKEVSGNRHANYTGLWTEVSSEPVFHILALSAL